MPYARVSFGRLVLSRQVSSDVACGITTIGAIPVLEPQTNFRTLLAALEAVEIPDVAPAEIH